MGRHRFEPLIWDAELTWDGRVRYNTSVHAFVRYLDPGGECREHIVAPEAYTIADAEIVREALAWMAASGRSRRAPWMPYAPGGVKPAPDRVVAVPTADVRSRGRGNQQVSKPEPRLRITAPGSWTLQGHPDDIVE